MTLFITNIAQEPITNRRIFSPHAHMQKESQEQEPQAIHCTVGYSSTTNFGILLRLGELQEARVHSKMNGIPNYKLG